MLQYMISKSVTRIGRDAGNDIALPNDDQASRVHAEIRQEGGLYVLYDLNSTNGTFVGDRRVTRHTLINGDRVRIGGARLTFQNGALLLSGGAVVSAQRPAAPRGPAWVPPVSQPASSSTPIVIAAVVGVLVMAAVLGVLVLMFAPPDGSGPEQIARSWVNGNLSSIATQIALSTPTIPLPPNVLSEKIHERIAIPGTWEYTPQKIAEGVYQVEARASFVIALSPPLSNCNVTAIYRLTVDTTSGSVREYSLTLPVTVILSP